MPHRTVSDKFYGLAKFFSADLIYLFSLLVAIRHQTSVLKKITVTPQIDIDVQLLQRWRGASTDL